jgi:hypothetical protein
VRHFKSRVLEVYIVEGPLMAFEYEGVLEVVNSRVPGLAFYIYTTLEGLPPGMGAICVGFD